jgi:hypothetical protein
MIPRRTLKERRNYAIARAMQQRRAELRPAREEIAELIDQIGWRRARPLVRAALGRPVQRAGLWRLGKRDTHRVLIALRERPDEKGQLCLFERDTLP